MNTSSRTVISFNSHNLNFGDPQLLLFFFRLRSPIFDILRGDLSEFHRLITANGRSAQTKPALVTTTHETYVHRCLMSIPCAAHIPKSYFNRQRNPEQARESLPSIQSERGYNTYRDSHSHSRLTKKYRRMTRCPFP